MIKLRIFPFASLVMALALLGAPLAMAHMKMVETSPAGNSEVPAGLSKITVKFSKAMRLTVIKIKQLDDDRKIALTSDLPKSFEPSAELTIDPLGAGRYRVSWTAVGKDGHVMRGKFEFSVRDTPSNNAQ